VSNNVAVNRLHLEPPTFKSLELERHYRKERLAGSCRIFALFGFDEGASGHITVRDPEKTDHFWVNPFGLHFSEVKVSDLLLVNQQGDVVEGDRPLNRAAFAIHSRIHEMRPDVIAAAHSHSIYGRTWSTLGRPLDPISQDACAFYEDHEVYQDYNGVVLDTDEGTRIGKVLGDKKAVILRNHGLLTVGQYVESAVWWYVKMDKCCQSQLLAEATGHRPVQIGHDQAKETHHQVGTEKTGWFHFQPLWHRVVREQPDFLH
jgi:ribulose-5-phosphate 4-epimerase/fuculose-1-phosphate aldolase